MASTQEKLGDLLAQIINQDQKLGEELQDKRSSAALDVEGINIMKEMVSNRGDQESFEEDYGKEAVILRVGRPVLIIRNNETELVFEEAESEVWRDRLLNAKQQLSLSIPAIGRIELQNHPSLDWCGTGWLIDKDTIVTNRHVAELFGRNGGAGFTFRQGDDGNPMTAAIDVLQEYQNPQTRTYKLKKILHIEPEPGPDMAFLTVEPFGDDMPAAVILATGKISDQSDVAVIGYPAKDSRMPDVELMEKIFGNVFGKKRLAPGKITNSTATRLFHNCSTLGGCSGSAVIDLNTGDAVGLHFAGRFLQSNYAVPIALVKQKLDAVKNKKTVVPVTPVEKPTPGHNGVTPAPTPAPTPTPAVPGVTVQAGAFTVTIPLQITVSLGGNGVVTGVVSNTTAGAVTPATPEAEPDEFITEGRAEDYADRKGYDADFLGEDFHVPLPEVVSEKRKKDILTYDVDGSREQVLRYQHYSVVMSKSRRVCLFSAVNINGAKSKKAARAPWRFDPRIPREAQIMNECYGNAPKYSRGHMTRREDPVWGREEEALQGNADSMCVTNTVPQMQSFNAPVWLALEDYALAHAREDKMQISVFTGPVLRPNDKVQYGVKIPEQFWKIIAFVHDETGELTATGYMMSQEEHMPDVEFVFGEFGTAQVSIASIEKKTGLSFGDLAGHDPMNDEAVGDPIRPLSDKNQVRF